MSFTRSIQPPQCVGEMIHRDLDFKPLLEQLDKLGNNSEARIELAAEEAAGAATLGLVEASNLGLNLAERCGNAIKTVFASDEYKNKSGVEMGFNRVPAMVLTDTFDQLVLSSDVLTPAKVAHVRQTVVAEGGCTIKVLYQAHRQRNKTAAGSHVELVVEPDNKNDGEPIVFCLALTLPDDGKWTIARSIIKQLTGCENLEPPAPQDSLSKAFSGPKGSRTFSPDNVLMVLPRAKWAASLAEYLARNKLDAVNTEPDCKIRVHTHPTEAITSYKGDVFAMSVYKQLQKLSEISIAGGRLLTFGGHLGMHSCITNAVRLLACALPNKFTAPESRFVPAKALIDLLIDEAEEYSLAAKPDARINEYDNLEVFKRATADAVRDHITKIWQDENMKLQLSGDLQSWANMYDNFATSHPDPDARRFYVALASAATHLLESKADSVLASTETLEDMMAQLGMTPAAGLSPPKQTAPPPFKLVEPSSLSADELDDLAAFLEKAMVEMDKPSAISDDEMMELAAEIFAALDKEESDRVTREFGPRAAQQLRSLTRPAPDQSAGAFLVERLETIAEMIEPGSTQRLEEEPSLTGSPAARERAYRAVGIALKRFPEQADRIKALCWLLFSDPLKIGLGLMVFWQSIRYAFSHDGGRTASLGPEIAGVLLFVALMPELEKLVNRAAMTTGGHLNRVKPLPYPLRIAQEIPQALLGGHLIGWTMSLIPAVAEGSNVPTRLASELARLVPGLCTVAGLNYVADVYLFRQEFDLLQTDGSLREAMATDLKRSARDLLSLRHWLTVRGPLAIALGAHRQTTQLWFSIFDKDANERVRNLVGGSQFATFYLSVKILSMLGGLPYDIENPRLRAIAPWLYESNAPRLEEGDEETGTGGN